MLQRNKRNENDGLSREDNIIHWKDAIERKLESMRAPRQVSISEREGVLLGIMPIEEEADVLLSRLGNKEWYAESLSKMSEERKREWLTVRVLLREMLDEEKEILYLPSGKPYLADNSYHLGISHTRGYVAVIVSKRHSVSVDIEYLSDRVERIAPRFLSDRELEVPANTPPALYYLIQWSAKESIFKWIDRENVEFCSQIQIAPFTPTGPNTWSSIKTRELITEEKMNLTVHYFIDNDYLITYICK